jgi:hypothetical protein
VDDYRARSALYVPNEARLSYLVGLPEGHDLGAAVDAAMRTIETHNPAPPARWWWPIPVMATTPCSGRG